MDSQLQVKQQVKKLLSIKTISLPLLFSYSCCIYNLNAMFTVRLGVYDFLMI